MEPDKTLEAEDKSQDTGDSVSTPEVPETTPKAKETTPKTYSEQDMKEVKTEARMWEGRVKVLEREKGDIQGKITETENSVKALDEEKKSLQKQIDELTGDDPDKARLLKDRKEIEGLRKQLQTDLTSFEADKQASIKEISDAREINRIAAASVISLKYDNGNVDKLLDMCEKFKIDSEKDIEELAESLWGDGTKPEPTTPSLKLDPGSTKGGAEITEEDRLKGRYPSMFSKK